MRLHQLVAVEHLDARDLDPAVFDSNRPSPARSRWYSSEAMNARPARLHHGRRASPASPALLADARISSALADRSISTSWSASHVRLLVGGVDRLECVVVGERVDALLAVLVDELVALRASARVLAPRALAMSRFSLLELLLQIVPETRNS
jgi:hypothetical protein